MATEKAVICKPTEEEKKQNDQTSVPVNKQDASRGQEAAAGPSSKQFGNYKLAESNAADKKDVEAQVS